jgi:RNA polymerase sigma factor (sigma-70 family)
VLLRSAADERLVEHVREGSSEAFETLFDRYHSGVLEFCVHMLGSLDEAEDAAQLTFLVAYNDLVADAHPVMLRAWLYGIARHRCLMALRARRSRAIRDVHDPLRRYELTAEVDVRDEVRGLLADVARLPDDQRAALVLAEIGGLSHAEIARVVGCPQRKVKALMFQARSSLRAARAARDTPCAEIREQLATLRGPAITRATLRRHLDGCAGCRAYRDALRGRRRRPLARLAWAPFVGVKRSVVGAVAGSGGSVGCVALTGGALGSAGLAVAVTIAATGQPPVARGGSVPMRPITRTAAPPSFGAQHAGSKVSARINRSRPILGPTLEGGDGDADAGVEAGAPGDVGATGTGERPAPQRPLVESDLPADQPVEDAEVAAPVLDPAQPVVEESPAPVPPGAIAPPATPGDSSASDHAPPAPAPAAARRPSPSPAARADDPRPSPAARADDPRPTPSAPASPRPDPQPPRAVPTRPDDHHAQATPPRPVNNRPTSAPARPVNNPPATTPGGTAPPARRGDGVRPPAPERADTGPARPNDVQGGSAAPPRPDNRDAASAAARPSHSGRNGAREPHAGSGADAPESSPEQPRARPH